MEEVRVDEAATPVEGGMPRRVAMQGIVGSLAGLAALGAVGAGAQERKKAPKKAAKKKAAPKKKTAKQSVGAQHAGQRGLIVRIRQVIKSVNVRNNSNEVLRMGCPRPPSGQRVFVVGGGYNLAGAFSNDPAFVIKTNAPDTVTSWYVDGHNVGTGRTITLGGYAICLYYRT